MKILSGVIVYDRINTINYWLKAWKNADKCDSKLVVVHNHDGYKPDDIRKWNILRWEPDFYYARQNIGMDIGAFRDVIQSDKFGEWDILFWCVDDNIPMCKDFLKHFIEPFKDNPKLGLVGNHWVHGSFFKAIAIGNNVNHDLVDHMRTTCFAVRKEVAKSFEFNELRNKQDCWAFEWADQKKNMTQQVLDMGYDILPVHKDWDKCWVDCSDYIWDIEFLVPNAKDPRCRKDHWAKYKAQFEKHHDRNNNKIQTL